MKEMKHKNVVEMYDVYDVGWMTCIFMEICEGGDLLGVSCQGHELFWQRVNECSHVMNFSPSSNLFALENRRTELIID